MAVFIKAKRVSGPLDDRVKARLLNSNSSSSGSEHDADAKPSCLCGLLHAFIHVDEPDTPETKSVASNCNCRIKSDDEETDDNFSANAAEMLQKLLDSSSKIDFQSLIIEAAKPFKCKRALMGSLRLRGYDAGLCKAKWEGSVGLIAGNYEYIDIVVDDNIRYIVDLDFATQFEVARATAEYEKLVAMLPRVMVVRAEEMKQIVRIMSEAARKSLKSRGLSMPPWRKRRYMMAKWFGHYRRTINPRPSSTSIATAGIKKGEVKCGDARFEDVTPRWGFVVSRTGFDRNFL